MELYTVTDGETFKKAYGTIFYKILAKDLIHNNFQYNLGLNVDTSEFNPEGECSQGGLYFAYIEHIFKFINYGTKIGIVEILDDSQVYIEDDKFKTDKFILKDTINLEDFFINQPRTVCNLATRQNGFILQYIIEQTEEICRLAIQQEGCAICYVIEQTEEICKLAVQQNGYALRFVTEQTEEICKLAVQQNGYALRFVTEQTEEICELAAQQNGDAL